MGRCEHVNPGRAAVWVNKHASSTRRAGLWDGWKEIVWESCLSPACPRGPWLPGCRRAPSGSVLTSHAAVTNYQRRGRLKQQTFLSSGGWKSKARVLADLVWWEASSWLAGGCLLFVASPGGKQREKALACFFCLLSLLIRAPWWLILCIKLTKGCPDSW